MVQMETYVGMIFRVICPSALAAPTKSCPGSWQPAPLGERRLSQKMMPSSRRGSESETGHLAAPSTTTGSYPTLEEIRIERVRRGRVHPWALRAPAPCRQARKLPFQLELLLPYFLSLMSQLPFDCFTIENILKRTK
jgi:hypothetical protein